MSWIASEIRSRGGAVPFDTYMDLCLYHPDHGYYSAGEPRFGRAGDYLTAPTASAWYPRILARLASRAASTLGPIRLVDVAAGDGSLVHGVVETLGQRVDEVLREIVAVERSDSMRVLECKRFRGESIRVVGELSSVQPGCNASIVHASELFDALPVARVVGHGGKLRELWVECRLKELVLVECDPREEVAAYFERFGVKLEEGQIAEANLSAASIHRRLLDIAGPTGLCLVLDYGYEARRLYDSRGRRAGSLVTYHRYQLGRDPLHRPGELDITAHVNWDDLRRVAIEAGWCEVGLWPLAEFFIRAGIDAELNAWGFGVEAELDASTFASRQEIKRLLDPEGMGSDLKVLVQASGSMVDTARAALALDSRFARGPE